MLIMNLNRKESLCGETKYTCIGQQKPSQTKITGFTFSILSSSVFSRFPGEGEGKENANRGKNYENTYESHLTPGERLARTSQIEGSATQERTNIKTCSS